VGRLSGSIIKDAKPKDIQTKVEDITIEGFRRYWPSSIVLIMALLSATLFSTVNCSSSEVCRITVSLLSAGVVMMRCKGERLLSDGIALERGFTKAEAEWRKMRNKKMKRKIMKGRWGGWEEQIGLSPTL